MHAIGLHSLQNHSHRGHEDATGGIQGIVIYHYGIYIQISKTGCYG
jgi:hypothetical protein